MEYLKEYKFFQTPGEDYSDKDPNEPFFNVNKGKYRKEKREKKQRKFQQSNAEDLERYFNITMEEVMGYLSQTDYTEILVNSDSISIGYEMLVDGSTFEIVKFGENYKLLYGDLTMRDGTKGDGVRRRIKSDSVKKLLQFIVDYLKKEVKYYDELSRVNGENSEREDREKEQRYTEFKNGFDDEI